VLLVLVVVLFAFIYYVTAPVKGPTIAWVSAGGLLAVTVWLIASAGLAVYVSQFGSYDKTYGALAGVIVLLLWIYVTNIALLLGVELNASHQKDNEMVKGGKRRPSFRTLKERALRKGD
jgi:membrane protein